MMKLISDLSTLLLKAWATLAQSISVITDPRAYCVARRRPSAHAFASALATLAHRESVHQAVKITAPSWSLAVGAENSPDIN
jgi:hypothetical protein